MKLSNKDNNLLFFILLILASVAFLFYINNYKLEQKQKIVEIKFAELQNTIANTPVLAKAFIIYDINDQKEIFNYNADIKLPLASLTKTMAVLVALHDNTIEKLINISPTAIAQEGNYGFSVGEKFNIVDLAKLTLIGSVNDGAQALVENTDNYLALMNTKAQRFGMKNTSFLNSTGLDLDMPARNAEGIASAGGKNPGALGSARDANTMAIYATIMYPEIFKATTLPEIKIKSNLGKIYTIKNTDEIIEKIPNLLFSKTGLTDLAGGNLSVIFENYANHKIAITLLGSTKEDRFTDMEKLVNLSYNVGINE